MAIVINKQKRSMFFTSPRGITMFGEAREYLTFAAMKADPFPPKLSFVKDATGDPTVDKGSAVYTYENGVWEKFYETEAMDQVIDGMISSIGWDKVTSKPTSFPSAPHDHEVSEVEGLTDVLGNINAIDGRLIDTETVLDISEDENGLPVSGLANRVTELETNPPQSSTPTWDEVTDKPESFPSTWETVSDKPNTFPPDAHEHSTLDSRLTSLELEVSGAVANASAALDALG